MNDQPPDPAMKLGDLRAALALLAHLPDDAHVHVEGAYGSVGVLLSVRDAAGESPHRNLTGVILESDVMSG